MTTRRERKEAEEERDAALLMGFLLGIDTEEPERTGTPVPASPIRETVCAGCGKVKLIHVDSQLCGACSAKRLKRASR